MGGKEGRRTQYTIEGKEQGGAAMGKGSESGSGKWGMAIAFGPRSRATTTLSVFSGRRFDRSVGSRGKGRSLPACRRVWRGGGGKEKNNELK